MNANYAKDLDLNLLRVFVVVAESRSVTAAAARLYLTQPAVSAALRRLAEAVGAALFVRAGRGLALTARGERLFATARLHVAALVDAALAPAVFDPATSERVVRIGVSDTHEAWLLPTLLETLARDAPRMRLVIQPVQFRTVADALASARVDVAITVADEVPVGTVRRTLFVGMQFVCLFDPRHAKLGKRPTVARYLAQDHVIVSYNGDLRGVVEDALGLERRVRISVPSFDAIGTVVDGTPLVATVPALIANQVLAFRPHLTTAQLPFSLGGGTMELLWPRAVDDDDAVRFVRDVIVRAAASAPLTLGSRAGRRSQQKPRTKSR